MKNAHDLIYKFNYLERSNRYSNQGKYCRKTHLKQTLFKKILRKVARWLLCKYLWLCVGFSNSRI